ncbi:MAG: septum formation protein Maf [Lachnospiraceae bacterium]|nr:septum formation protein Maf [Lachnospiraceae bacterium]
MKRKNKLSKVILASNSPRRREILEQVGISFDVIPSDLEEVITQTEPNKIVLELSMQKAEDVYNKALKDILSSSDEENEHIIIAADTVVEVDGKIMGKPKDRQDAYNMINAIQGRTHNVLTGVTLIICNGFSNTRKISFYESTEVEIYDLTDEEINKYLDSDESYDKAGAYAVQGLFAAYVRKLNGDYYNVVGLPISRILRELRGML